MAASEPPAGLARWVPSLPQSLISSLSPFSREDDAAATNPASPPVKRQSFLAAILPAPAAFAGGPVSNQQAPQQKPTRPSAPSHDDSSNMFDEPDGRSRSGSDNSREGSTDGAGRRRRNSVTGTLTRPKTCFSICHPPPASATRQRLSRRHRGLLQLHKLCAPPARPRPAFEVLPSANLGTRLSAAAITKPRGSQWQSDMLVMRAENYAPPEDDDDDTASGATEERERDAARDVVALICKAKKEEIGAPVARICLAAGPDWDAYPITNGGYEFMSTDEHGLALIVRWVPKKSKDGGRHKFNFSTISPNSRRHPVIASLSRTGLQINDTYRIPEPTGSGAAVGTPRSTPGQAPTALEEAMKNDSDSQSQWALAQRQHETDARLRELIITTGIWVLFREGWSPSTRHDSDAAIPQSPTLSAHGRSPSKTALPPGSPLSTPPASPGLAPREKRTSIKSFSSGILRRQSALGGYHHANRASQASVPEDALDGIDTKAARSGRSRANSQSTVLIHRAASNRRDNNLATWRPDPVAAPQEREISHEPFPTSDAELETDGEERPEEENVTNPAPAAPLTFSATPTATANAMPQGPIQMPAKQPDGRSTEHSQAGVGPQGAMPTLTAIKETSHLRSPLPKNSNSPSSQRQSHAASTTSTTDASSDPVAIKGAGKIGPKKRRGAWRRLLCGAGHAT